MNVIENPKQGKGKSHYEWDMARQNRSWKAKLKDKIDAAIMNCTGFDDFLYQLKQQDVNVVYRPENVISLKYCLEGMKRFCRSRTLGWYYEEKQIRKRIDNYQRPRRRLVCMILLRRSFNRQRDCQDGLKFRI